MSALHSTSPTDWFQTKLYSLELPQYKWYIAILLAVMVQVITGDLELYLDMTWIKNKGEASSFIVDGVISFILTEFMFSLTLLSLLTVCPQHIKLLFMILEMAVFCLPALVHTFILRRGIFSKLDSISFALQVGLLFFTIEKSFLCGILLYIVKFITNKARDIWPDCILRSTASADAFNVGRYAEHNGRLIHVTARSLVESQLCNAWLLVS